MSSTLHSEKGFTVWTAHSLKKCFRYDKPEKVDSIVNIEAARNEYESFQVLVTPASPKAVRGVRLELTDLTSDGARIDKENIRCWVVGYVPVKTRSAEWGERCSSGFGEEKEVGIIPGDFPDPLFEADEIDVFGTQPFWVTLYVPPDARPGDYSGEIWVKTSEMGRERLELKLRVWDFTLPRRLHLRTWFGLSIDKLRKYYEGLSQEELESMVEKYRRNLSEHRINPWSLEYEREDFSIEVTRGPGKEDFSVDYTEFDKKVQSCLDLGLNAINVPLAPALNDMEGHGPLSRTHRRSVLSRYLRDLQAHLERKGWLDEALIFLYDEPSPEDYDLVREEATFYKKNAPRIKRLCSKMDPALLGYVDIWCPETKDFNPEFASQRQSLGEEIWWYVCCAPLHPYANFFIDYPAVDHRVLFWQTWKYSVQGFVYWNVNYWVKNPYEDTLSYATVNGDGVLVYPGKEGPVNSIRWEVVRDGVEDYEYLWTLKQKTVELQKKSDELKESNEKNTISKALKAAKKAMAEVDIIARSTTEYTKKPEDICKVRRQIAIAIQEMNKLLTE